MLSAEGIIPLSRSFDTAGPMTRTVRDAAVLFEALAGLPITSSLDESVSALKVGIARKGFFDDLEPDVALPVEEALATIARLVAKVSDVPLEVAGHRTIFNAEIYEYHEPMITKTPCLYQPNTLERIRKCAGISATDYIRDWRELQVERRAAESVFEQVDLVITPTVPVVAPKISELESLAGHDLRNFETKYLLRNTAPFSVLYWPSRCRYRVGFPVTGCRWDCRSPAGPGADATVLRFANAYEQATDWHRKTVKA